MQTHLLQTVVRINLDHQGKGAISPILASSLVWGQDWTPNSVVLRLRRDSESLKKRKDGAFPSLRSSQGFCPPCFLHTIPSVALSFV